MSDSKPNAIQFLHAEYDALFKLVQVRADLDTKIMMKMSAINQIVGNTMSNTSVPVTTETGPEPERKQEVPAQPVEQAPVQEAKPEPTPEPEPEPAPQMDANEYRKAIMGLFTEANKAGKKSEADAILSAHGNPAALTVEQMAEIHTQMEKLVNG